MDHQKIFAGGTYSSLMLHECTKAIALEVLRFWSHCVACGPHQDGRYPCIGLVFDKEGAYTDEAVYTPFIVDGALILDEKAYKKKQVLENGVELNMLDVQEVPATVDSLEDF